MGILDAPIPTQAKAAGLDVIAPGTFDAARAVYNLKSSHLRRTRAKIGAARAGTGMFNYMGTGTSLTEGVGGTGRPNVSSYPAYLIKALEARGIPIAGTGPVFLYNNNNDNQIDGRFRGADGTTILSSTNWVGVWNGTPTLYRSGTGVGKTFKFVSDRPGPNVNIVYGDFPGQAFTVSVDGDADRTVTSTGTNTMKKYTITGLTDAVHTVTITVSVSAAYIQSVEVTRAAGASIANAGIGSSQSSWWNTTSLLMPLANTSGSNYTPDLVTIEGPVNNALNNVSIASTKADYTAIIAKYRSTSPAADVLLICDPYPSTAANILGGGFTQLTDSFWLTYRQMMYDLAKENDVPLLDLGFAFGSNATYAAHGMNNDGVHLKDSGYAAIADRIAALLV